MQDVVLLLDEDRARRRLICFGLRCADFVVVESDSMLNACTQVLRHQPDLLLIIAPRLDAGLRASIAGLCGKAGRTPVLLVLERCATTDINQLRGSGINCLTGAPTPHQLVGQIRELLDTGESVRLVAGESAGLKLDFEGGVLCRGSSSVALGPKERRVLKMLLEHPDQVIPKQQLLYRIWGARADHLGRVVDVSICRLRRALRQLDCADRLQTVRAAGYRFITTGAAVPGMPRGKSPTNFTTAPTGVHQ